MDESLYIWAVDLEGSGASPPEIVDLALVEICGIVPTGCVRHWRVRPDRCITPQATRIHRLTDADVAEAPPVEAIRSDVMETLADRPILGHNVSVDLRLLQRAFPGWHPPAAYDTLRMTRRLAPARNHGLTLLIDAYDLHVGAACLSDGASRHSALYDAAACALLFQHLMEPIAVPARRAELNAADVLDVRQGRLL
ncbi:3'-5' exonuclease [Jannaschia sp. LMIT008]|uniref:3'-5' exonuclease n=1 Tax=Jannaschia maritima TaxID=3032585 RepID=UPI002811DDFB|nr:3'-5' exonuclease [Jannaschia sp. LMIT008]